MSFWRRFYLLPVTKPWQIPCCFFGGKGLRLRVSGTTHIPSGMSAVRCYQTATFCHVHFSVRNDCYNNYDADTKIKKNLISSKIKNNFLRYQNLLCVLTVYNGDQWKSLLHFTYCFYCLFVSYFRRSVTMRYYSLLSYWSILIYLSIVPVITEVPPILPTNEKELKTTLDDISYSINKLASPDFKVWHIKNLREWINK